MPATFTRKASDLGIGYKDLSTHESSLEDIFVEMVHAGAAPAVGSKVIVEGQNLRMATAHS